MKHTELTTKEIEINKQAAHINCCLLKMKTYNLKQTGLINEKIKVNKKPNLTSNLLRHFKTFVNETDQIYYKAY